MITATGNNFGAGTIQFKDYQSEEIIVLNGAVTYDPSNEEYVAADTLEIYVPTLSLKRSAPTALFIRYTYNSSEVVSIVKCWIKNANTICLEKLKYHDSSPSHTLQFNCAFVPKGEHTVPVFEGETSLTLEGATDKVVLYQQHCIVRPGWVMLFIEWNSFGHTAEDTEFSFYLRGLPSDIDSDFPMIHNTTSRSNSLDVKCHLTGDTLTCYGLKGSSYSITGGKFMKAFFVRG